MPPLPGEERVQTVFADVHYYFIAPSPRPVHHRFDKGSYFYIYQNATRDAARLEIANNPGTPDQDAFQGSLDGVKLRYSYKFPTLLTLVVDPKEATPNSASSSPAKDTQEWRLASADPRDQGQYKYRLHTLDIYFWTLEDAKEVIQSLKRLLRPQQLDVLDAPRTSRQSQEHMSPVVQQLENVAITDPAYGNGQTRNSQNKATILSPPPPPTLAKSTQSSSSLTGSAGRPASVSSNQTPTNFAPMAYNPAAPAAPEPIAHREKTPPPADAANGTGLAAAAYADHTQAHAGTHAQPHPGGVVGQPQPPSGHYGSPPPPQPGSGYYGSPPQSAYASPSPGRAFQHTPSVTSTTSSHRTSATGPHAATTSSASSPTGRHQPISQPSYAPPLHNPNAHLYSSPPGTTAAQSPRPSQPSQTSFVPPPPGPPPPTQQTQDQNAHAYNSQPQQSQAHPQSYPLESPSAEIYGSPPVAPHPHQPLQHLQPQYPDYLQSRNPPQAQSQAHTQPPGGYSQSSYAQQEQQQHQQPHHHHHHHHYDDGSGGGNRYDVHNQIYRPTQEEDRHSSKHRKSSSTHSGGGAEGRRPGKLEETAGKVDKKVGGFLKRLEKRL